MNWRAFFKCSSCERLKDVTDLLRMENDTLRLERDQWKQEFFKIVHKLNDMTASGYRDTREEKNEDMSENRLKPIRGVGNPRKILRSLEVKDLNSFKEKQKSFEAQVKDASKIS